MQALRYSYPNARIRGMKARLLSGKDFETALKSSSFKDYTLWLGNTSYKEILEGTKEAEIEKIEAHLWKNLMKENEKIFSMTPNSAKEFMELRLRGYEILALKNLINLKAAEEEGKDFYASFFTNKKIKQRAEKLKSTKDVSELIGLLADTEYGEILRAALEDYEKSKNPFHLTLALDNYYLGKLWKACEKLSSHDKIIARELIGLEIDMLNIMVALRTLGKENQEKYFLPCHYHLKKENLERCLKSKTIHELIGKLSESKYGKILNDALADYEKEKSLLPLELALKRNILKKNKVALQGDPFHIGTLLGYLKLKETEIDNLRITTVSISHGLSGEEFSNLLVT